MKNKLIHRSLSIIPSTIVIDESGINGVSTREIAKRVGISEPAIFRHFKTKTDLLVLDYFGHYDSDIKILSSEQLAYLIMGTNRELCLNWRIQNYRFSLREQMITTLTYGT